MNLANPFNWLRNTVKAAFLGGIQDAIAELNQSSSHYPAIDVTPASSEVTDAEPNQKPKSKAKKE